VVFRVSGTIDVCKNNQQLFLNNPHITIAGQTAQVTDTEARSRTEVMLLASMVILLTGVFTYKRFAKLK